MRHFGAFLLLLAVVFAAFAIGAVALGYWLSLSVDSFLALVCAAVGWHLYRRPTRA